MIVLDTNETILSPKNIRECKTKEQLISYLKFDLLGQALNKGKNLEYNTITITDEEEKDYTLNIGTINNNNVEDKILIPFYLENVIQYFSTKKEDKYELNYNINFENIIISSGLFVQNVNFNGSVYFRNTTLQLNVRFYNSNFNKVLVFSNSNFCKMQRLEFDNIEFNNMLSFADCEFKCRVEIKNSKFNGVSFFAGNTFNYILLFRECELNNIICFYTSNFKLNLKFVNTAINRVMYFRGSTINELTFNEVKFNDNSILSIDNNFIENNFYDGLFNSLLNEEKLKNKNNEINKLFFYNIVINGKIDLQNIEVNDADFKGSFISRGLINPISFKVHKFANRESVSLLKQQAYARNNIIDALQYQAQEIELHKEELKEQFKENKNLKTFGDILSIELSSLYSDNGQNWIRALGMTIFITAFCFIVFYIPDLTQSNIIRLYYKNLFPELIKYFIPTDYTLLIKYAESNLHLLLKIFGVLVYFLGKVLFWYGSVQTVTAFRKFAKGA